MRFLKATIEGNYLALTDETRAKDVLARISRSPIRSPRHHLQRLQGAVADRHRISRQGAENILAQFPGGSQKAEDYIDTSLLDALRSEGFFAAMEQKYKR